MKIRLSDWPALLTTTSMFAFLSWKETIALLITIAVGIPTAVVKWIEMREAIRKAVARHKQRAAIRTARRLAKVGIRREEVGSQTGSDTSFPETPGAQ